VVYVHYLDRMSEPEIEAAIDRAMARGASNDVLVLFERHLSTLQQQTVLKKLLASPTRTPQAALTLAKLYHRLGQDANSKRELLRAQVLLRAVDNPGDVESQLRTLAKELGDEKLLERPVDVQQLLDLGFKELKPAMPVVPQEVGFEQPVLFVVKPGLPKEELRTIAVRVARPDSAESSAITLAYVEVTGSGRSWGTFGSQGFCQIGDAGSFCFKAQPLDSKERFRITAQWLKSDRR
jgi:signal transduction histidine kinase